MKKVFIILLTISVLLSCSKNEMVLEEAKEITTFKHQAPINYDLITDRRRSVVGADIIGGIFGFLGGGFWGSVLWGSLASLSQATLNELENISYIPGFAEDNVVFNLGNPYEFIGILHYSSINDELRNTLGKYNKLDTELFDSHFKSLGLYYNLNSSQYPRINIDEYSGKDYKADFEVFLSFSKKDKLDWLSENLDKNSYIILKDYLETLNKIGSVKDFVSKSIEIENSILIDKSLDLISKELLLGAMSTARIGLQYWTIVFIQAENI